MARKLYVGNLPYSIGEAELQELFAKAGTVETVRVMRAALRKLGAPEDLLQCVERPSIATCVARTRR